MMQPVTRSGKGKPGGSSPNFSKQVTVVKPTLERASASRETSCHSTPPRLWTEHILRGGGRDKQARGDARREGGAGDGERDVGGSEVTSRCWGVGTNQGSVVRVVAREHGHERRSPVLHSER